MGGKKASPKWRGQRKKVVAKKAPTLERREDRFAQEYVIDLRGKDAAIRAGYSAHTARVKAAQLLAVPRIRARVDELLAERADRTGITADKVLERVWAIANADPRELIETRRICCRYCYGTGHRYQRTPREMEVFRAEFDKALEAKAKVLNTTPELLGQEFDPQGGIGYDPRKDPVTDCPECFGFGEKDVFIHDQRDLSPAARMLYAGTKVTEKGIEVKMHSQTEMLIKAGNHVGLFKGVEISGPGGKPIENSNPGLEALFAQVAATEQLIGPPKSRHGK